MTGTASTPSPLPLPWGDPVTYSAAMCSVTRHDAACERRDQAVEELRKIAESCQKLAEPIRPPRVLLVEDDRCTASYIAERFEEQLGAEVVTVHDGVEAMALLERDARWSVVVLDLRLPGENGIELARMVERHVPLAMVSAYWTDNTTAAADVLGVRWRLRKPFEYRALVDFVSEVGAAISPAQ